MCPQSQLYRALTCAGRVSPPIGCRWQQKREPSRGDGSLFRCIGGAEGTRTPDPLHAMQVRYQLRHSPVLLPLPVEFPGAT